MYKCTFSGDGIGRHSSVRAAKQRKYRRTIQEFKAANKAFQDVYQENTGMTISQLLVGVLKAAPFVAALYFALKFI